MSKRRNHETVFEAQVALESVKAGSRSNWHPPIGPSDGDPFRFLKRAGLSASAQDSSTKLWAQSPKLHCPHFSAPEESTGFLFQSVPGYSEAYWGKN